MSGTVIFDDIDNTNPGTNSLDGSVSLAGVTDGNYGISFTVPSTSMRITSIELPLLEENAADTGTLTVTLWSDSGDPANPNPSALIATLGTITAATILATEPNTSTPVDITLTVSGAPTMTASTRYWIELSEPNANQLTGIDWFYSNDVSASGSAANEYYETTGAVAANSTGPVLASISAQTACFAAGTRILTDIGEVAVEALRPGDLVAALRDGGLAPVRWIGHRRVECRRHPRPHDVWPVRVAPGAFGAGRPRRELVLSPDHAVFIAGDEVAPGGALVPIRYLLNGATICQTPIDSVTYYHVELDRHDVLLAEGLPTETYLDTGNRAAFVNGGGETMAHPDFARGVWQAAACAPLATDPDALASLRTRLRLQAETLGHVLTTDPDVHMIVDGVRVDGERAGARYRFVLPPGGRDIRLASRSAIPAETNDDAPDARRLGIAVVRVIADGIPLDRAAGCGWYDPEPAWQWTDGFARLDCPDANTVEVDVAMSGRYWLRPAVARRGFARAA